MNGWTRQLPTLWKSEQSVGRTFSRSQEVQSLLGSIKEQGVFSTIGLIQKCYGVRFWRSPNRRLLRTAV